MVGACISVDCAWGGSVMLLIGVLFSMGWFLILLIASWLQKKKRGISDMLNIACTSSAMSNNAINPTSFNIRFESHIKIY